jgi:hypothetical protein
VVADVRQLGAKLFESMFDVPGDLDAHLEATA